VTSLATRIVDEITERVVSLNAATPEQWDGNWLNLAVTIPDQMRTTRKPLYSAFDWAGFGHPAPGLWVSPHTDRLPEISAVVAELGLEHSTIAFIARIAPAGLAQAEIISRAWNLDEVAARYAALLETYQDIEPSPGDEMLFSYLALVDEWRKFPYMDPQLPHALLPDWVGRRAADTFMTLRNRWKPAAHQRWAEIVRATAPQN
jgi:phenylacetic acid degradation operon negative regulatory protein